MKTERFLSALPGAPAGRRRASWLLRSPLVVGGLAFAAFIVAFARGLASAPVAGVGVYIALVLMLKGALGGRTREWDSLYRPFPRPRSRPGRRSSRLRLAAAIAAVVAGPSAVARAQQTIFNVPSADVLDPGTVYAEVDELFRPTEPSFSSTAVRGVFGIVPRVEAGVNFAGLVSPGPVVPTATLAVKLQPLRAGGFALTAGAYGLFYLQGASQGDPSGLGYAFASYKLAATGTRVEVGGWYASAGFVHPPHRALGSSAGGALATFEQPLPWVKGLEVAADWWSGNNSIGYLSPGLIYSTGHWTLYGAYTIKNGDSKGNGGLLEVGFTF